MIFAFLTTLFWTMSSVVSARAAKALGGPTANRLRLVVALTLLGLLWVASGGPVWGGAAWWLIASGAVGLGLGDHCLFSAYQRLGARLPVLLTHCLAVPLAGGIEWLWLGNPLRPIEMFGIVVILAGLVLGLAPGKPTGLPRRVFWSGVALSVLSAVGLATSAVLSRKAVAIGLPMPAAWLPGLDMAVWRNVGGLAVALALWTWERGPALTPAAWRQGRWWVLLSGVVGPGLGVVTYQAALLHTHSAVVQAVVALVPLLVIPVLWHLEGDRPAKRAIAGGLLAVSGVIAMAWWHVRS